MPTTVGLFGHPVRQNLSAIMHNAAFDALGMDWRYVLRDVEPVLLAREVRAAVDEGWVGWNVTIPHKVAIASSMDRLSPEAALIGAVNTVRKTGDELVGHNTDGAGFIAALKEEAGVSGAGMRVVQIGSGGAGRATAVYLAKEAPAEIALLNRSPERSANLASMLSGAFPNVPVRVLDENTLRAALADADLVVNTTSVGMWPRTDAEPPIDPAWLSPGSLVYDIINNPPRTGLLRAADARGCRVLGGLGMLVMQGAIAFKLWTGREAPVRVMRQAAETAVANWK